MQRIFSDAYVYVYVYDSRDSFVGLFFGRYTYLLNDLAISNYTPVCVCRYWREINFWESCVLMLIRRMRGCVIYYDWVFIRSYYIKLHKCMYYTCDSIQNKEDLDKKKKKKTSRDIRREYIYLLALEQSERKRDDANARRVIREVRGIKRVRGRGSSCGRWRVALISDPYTYTLLLPLEQASEQLCAVRSSCAARSLTTLSWCSWVEWMFSKEKFAEYFFYVFFPSYCDILCWGMKCFFVILNEVWF